MAKRPPLQPVIRLPRGTVDKMCRELMIGRTTLYEALNYSSDSPSAKRTRDLAISKYGGVETTRPRFNN